MDRGTSTEGEGIRYRSDLPVELLEVSGTDHSIAAAARVSTRMSRKTSSSDSDAALIDYLMENRHGTPFEHNFISFYVEAPIFVTRQLLKHRVGVSVNEHSGRYREFKGEFYIPTDLTRPLVQEGHPGRYDYTAGSTVQWAVLSASTRQHLKLAWDLYVALRRAGISKEVARMNLPLSTYSSVQISFNVRSLMHFLSLRVDDEGSTYATFPQWETAQVALAMEKHLQRAFPAAHATFVKHGRVAP